MKTIVILDSDEVMAACLKYIDKRRANAVPRDRVSFQIEDSDGVILEGYQFKITFETTGD